MRLRAAFLAVVFSGIVQDNVGVAATDSIAPLGFNTVRSQFHPVKRTDALSNVHSRAVDLSVGSWCFFGQTPDQISGMLDQHSARLVTIRVEDPSIPTFAGSMVANTGAYGSAWWWYYGVDATALGTLLTDRTLISLDPYQNSAGLVFVAIMLPNVGSTAIGWWWYFGLDMTAVNGRVNANNARLISARPYLNGNQLVYAVIMVSAATDSRQWQWLSGQSTDAITTAINTNQERLVSLAPNPNGGWDAVLVASTGENWFWWTDLDSSTVTSNLNSHGTLLVDLSSYIENGSRKYAGVELGDGPSNSTSPTSSSSPTGTSRPVTGTSLPASGTPLPTNGASTQRSTKPQTKIIIIGSVCGGLALAIIALLSFLLYRRGRKPGKTSTMSFTSEPTKIATPTPPHSVTPERPAEGGYPYGGQPSPPPVSQTVPQPVPQFVQQPVPQFIPQPIPPQFISQPGPQMVPQPITPTWAPSPVQSSISSYQYGYVPPTDAIFNVGQNPDVNVNTNVEVAPPPPLPQL